VTNVTSSTDRVQFSLHEGIATVTLQRPEAANAIDLDMARELLRIAVTCNDDPAVRVVVLQGAGPRFCVGGDVRSFAAAGEGVGRLIKDITHHLHAAVVRFTRMDAPLITVVRGPAAGAGLGLALAGDIVIAAPGASFYPAYLAAGLSPDGGLTYVLPRLVGLRRAQQILLQNTPLDAAAALQAGLITNVVEDAAIEETVREIAQGLARAPRRAVAAAKRLLGASLTATLETQLDAESMSIARLALTPDGREGVAALLAKRKPTFE